MTRWGVEWRGRVFELASLSAAMDFVEGIKPPVRIMRCADGGEWVPFGGE